MVVVVLQTIPRPGKVKARANKAKAATAPKPGEHMPRKGKREGGSLKEPPRKAVLPSIEDGARQQTGPYCFNTSTWSSKWPATEVHSFIAATFFA